MAVREFPPRGHYLADEVGRLAGVSGREIGQWAHYGYIRASQHDGPDYPLVYAFQDIAEAMIVHELIDASVRRPEILAAVRHLQEQHGTAWPLTHSVLRVTVTAEMPDGTQARAHLLVHDGARFIRPAKSATQGVLEVDTRAVEADLERGGWVVRDLPDLEHIEVNPDRLSGRPAIRGRRIAAEDVARMAAEPGGTEMLRDDYDLSTDEIRDARRWWDRVRQYEAA